MTPFFFQCSKKIDRIWFTISCCGPWTALWSAPYKYKLELLINNKKLTRVSGRCDSEGLPWLTPFQLFNKNFDSISKEPNSRLSFGLSYYDGSPDTRKEYSFPQVFAASSNVLKYIKLRPSICFLFSFIFSPYF